MVILLALLPIQAKADSLRTHDNDVNFEDVYLLGQIMEHEAKYEGEEGLTAVAEVVFNRINSDRFPDTVSEVIFQKNQFTDAEEIAGISPDIKTLEIAERILRGNVGILNDENILFFRNAGGSTKDWGSYKYMITINHHQFYAD